MSDFAERLAVTLAAIPNVVAVTLGGSRAREAEHLDSDWDFGLYYRKSISASDVRALGYEGTVVEPGEWGRLVNGGAWLTVEGRRVDLLYRELEVVEHWLEEANEGRYERDHVEGYVAGMPTYVLAGELAVARVLHGTLPRPSYPEALRRTASTQWEASAEFSLWVAEKAAARADVPYCAGLLAKAAISAANGRLARRGEWVLNEKGVVDRAGLGRSADVLTGLASDPTALTDAIAAMREVLSDDA